VPAHGKIRRQGIACRSSTAGRFKQRLRHRACAAVAIRRVEVSLELVEKRLEWR
jgi:hypothetical protein